MKRNEVLIHDTHGKTLKPIISERNQSQKPIKLRFHLHEKSPIGKYKEAESRLQVPEQGWGRSTGQVEEGSGGRRGVPEEQGVATNEYGFLWGR